MELPEIKGHYAEIDINSADDDAFWNDAYDTAIDSVRCWNPDLTDPPGVDCGDSEVSGYAITDIGPDNTVAERLRHKVLYLYSGVTYSERDPPSLIHPQADWTTWPNAPSAARVGYRYVMGERQGWGDDRDNHSLDEFAGIGMHVHEIGHLHDDSDGPGWRPCGDAVAVAAADHRCMGGFVHV